MIHDTVAVEKMLEWLDAEIERARQLLVENPINTRKVLERVRARLARLSER